MEKNDGYTLLDINKSEDWKFLKQLYLEESSLITPPFFNMLNDMKNAGCNSVLVENKYIDKDYRSEYSKIYYKMFRHYKNTCKRLHFFKEKLDSIQAIEGEKDPKYLGYIVLRPVVKGRVGRSVTSPPFKNSNKDYVLCKSEYKAHLFGNEFSVTGCPFIEQDAMVMECARATLWTTAYYLHRKFGSKRVLPSEFVENDAQLAGISGGLFGRIFPAEGLMHHQMLAMLSNVGYSPIYFLKQEGDSEWDPIDLIYPYIESGIPVIITVPQHAITCVGHTFNPNPELPKISKGPCIVSSKHWIDGLIIHDDGLGPYRLLPVPQYRQSLSKDYKPLLPPAQDIHGEDDHIYQTTGDIEGLIIPLPDKIYIPGEYIQIHSLGIFKNNDFIKYLSPAINSNRYAKELSLSLKKPRNPVVLRTYFCLSEEYKKGLRNRSLNELTGSKSINAKVAEIYKTLSMPRFIWITEITTAERLSKVNEHDRTILGEIIYDSTVQRDDPFAWISIHLPGVITTQAHKNKFETFMIADDAPYSHLSRK